MHIHTQGVYVVMVHRHMNLMSHAPFLAAARDSAKRSAASQPCGFSNPLSSAQREAKPDSFGMNLLRHVPFLFSLSFDSIVKFLLISLAEQLVSAET